MDNVADAVKLWTACEPILRNTVSESVWTSVLQDLEPVGVENNVLLLAAPSSIAVERIEGRFRAIIVDALNEVQPALTYALTVRVKPAPVVYEATPASYEEDSIDMTEVPQTPVVAARTDLTPRARGTVAAESAQPRHTFESFVIGASNRFAQAAALSVAETPGRTYNPLFIYGEAGLGKTHLLQAIGSFVEDNYPGYKVRYVSSETMMNHFVEAIRNNSMAEFKQEYRDLDVLLIDDVQFLVGKERIQEEFFHTFNHLHDAGRQIVLSSDRSPDNIATLEDRLRSRFKMGLITDIQPPDLETRFAILRQKNEHEGGTIDDNVLEYIATNISNNIRELEGGFNRVSAFQRLNRTIVTIDTAETILTDLLTNNEPLIITAQLILEHVSVAFNFTMEDLKGRSRRRPLVNARQIAMYVMRELTDLSYPAIGREFGNRDHTTVIHAVEKIKSAMGEKHQVLNQVRALTTVIKSGKPPELLS